MFLANVCLKIASLILSFGLWVIDVFQKDTVKKTEHKLEFLKAVQDQLNIAFELLVIADSSQAKIQRFESEIAPVTPKPPQAKGPVIRPK